MTSQSGESAWQSRRARAEKRGERRRERAQEKRKKKPPKARKGPPKRSRTYHCLVAAGVIPPQEDRRYTRRKDYVPPAASPPPGQETLASATLAESGSPPTPQEAELPIKPPPPKLRISLAKLVRKRELCALLLPVLEELKNRLSHPAETYVPDDHPERPQKAFHESKAMIRVVGGGNQCVALDTLIQTERGPVPAADVQVGDKINGGTVTKRWISPEPVKTWTIECEGGFQLTGNAEHPIMTRSGWKTMAEIGVDDEVKLAMGYLAPLQTSQMTPRDGYFAGLMVGDGCLSHHHGVMSFTSNDEELHEWMRGYLRGICEPRPDSKPIEIRWCSEALKERWLHLWGGTLATAKSKTVPRECMTDYRVAREFLRGYTATDGCVYTKGEPKDRAVIWISASGELLRQVQQLLLQFHVYSTLSYTPEKKGYGKTFPQWRLRARGPAADNFMQFVGPGLQRKQAGWRWAEVGSQPERWARVRDKSYAHKKYVIGHTVEPTNEYVTNGIQSHNSGKSFSVAQEIRMWLTGDHPYQEVPRAAKIYLISSSYRTIQEGVWRHLKDCIPGWRIEAKGPNIPGGWQIPTWVRMREGAQIDFISGEGREDARKKIQAAALHLFVIDEEVDELLWKECQVRLLRHGGRVVIAATFVRSEPWILDLEDRAEAGDKDIDIFRSSTYRARDCGHVDAKVVQFLESSYSEEERQVRLLGRSRRSEGLVYPTFGKQHICEPFEVPASWTRYCAIDPGFRTCAVIWAAVSPSNYYVIYREMYYHGRDFDEVLRGILVAEGYEPNPLDPQIWVFREGKTEDLAHRWIDPSAFSHHTTGALGWGVLLAQTSHRLGVGTRLTAAPARNDVVPGIEAIRRDLMEGIGGTPRLRIFSSCSNLIRELRNYRWKQSSGGPRTQDPKDAPVKKDDHGADCLRYLSNMGLTYRKPLDPWLTGNREDLLSIGAATSMDDRWKEHWRLIYERQRDGAERTQPHPSGIGSEY